MGFLIVFYGDGKGKTTAAIGCAVRAVGHGFKVVVAHFAKSRPSGEFAVLRSLPNVVHLVLGRESLRDRDRLLSDVRHVLDVVRQERPFMVVLDELGVAAYRCGISANELAPLIQEMLSLSHVVVTGKYMPRELIEMGDLVTEMRCIRHYYQRGVASVRGLEW